ncbi:MAG: hypothetical protein LBS96_08995 [Oscillospiraceae bacterium]|jgi:hypothetical protein|nr:hypothetical protein [Oscillospiraceae bacterium]
MKMGINCSASSYPECQDFLHIDEDGKKQTISEFISNHKDESISTLENVLNRCDIDYRGDVKKYTEMRSSDLALSERLPCFYLQTHFLLIRKPDKAAEYFAQKAGECLQFARFFTMISASILDTNENISWSPGYVSIFWFRCIYFGTATTWFTNCFDHILQIVYWGYELFKEIPGYKDTWTDEKINSKCKYAFVVGKLRSRGREDICSILESCWKKIKKVREWSNHIKHKGGIDYKYLVAKTPCEIAIKAIKKTEDELIRIEEFKSPIEVDIDENISVLIQAHEDLFSCLSEIVRIFDFDSRTMKFK